VRIPPTNGPTAMPIPMTPAQTPIPLLCSSGGKALLTIESEAVKNTPAPTPCTARTAISHQSARANPHKEEATIKRVVPMSSSRRRPKMSAKRPAATITTAKAKRYAFAVHCSPVVEVPSSRPMAGRTIMTPPKSMVIRMVAKAIATTTHHLRFRSLIATILAPFPAQAPMEVTILRTFRARSLVLISTSSLPMRNGSVWRGYRRRKVDTLGCDDRTWLEPFCALHRENGES
jgi:hypothetical protein